MHWNYRIVRYSDGMLALHEVYYGDDGKPTGRTEDGASFGCDESEEGVEGITGALEMALKGARLPVLDDADITGTLTDELLDPALRGRPQ